MKPSPAEIARTLVRGRLPGRLQLAGETAPTGLAHAADRAGRPLILVRDSDQPPPAGPATLTVVDVPPMPEAPSLGRVLVEGSLHRLSNAAAAVAVHTFAEGNPVADLLDVGRGASLCRLTVTRVQLDRGSTTIDVDLADYAGAEPDPLHEYERDLLADLAGHHRYEVESYLRCLLALNGRAPRVSPRPLRLDRYGFTVDVGEPGRYLRLSFLRPVHCRHELAHLLRPVLFPSCADGPPPVR
ncbi:MAG TPA: DUF2470 domain-containing protein [Natronosporangium sp.]